MNTARPLPYLLESDRTSRWYYRDAPPIGAVVMFTNETYIDRVSRVTLTHVHLESGHTLLRPYIGRRLVRWSIHQYTSKRRMRSTYVKPVIASMARKRHDTILFFEDSSVSTA